ncbi:MAG: hypothetical protein IMF20_02525 [Proteobacteria bacterium]|jgi:hypothetical protein|nr:hypothetical protein [Pseudomonadota bacterium]
MIITTWNGKSFDTEKDLNAPERHILQKLFAWESMVTSLEQFKQKKQEALLKGWNNSGPIQEGMVLKVIIKNLEKKVAARLGTNGT